ncbi:unnamed protein product [Protopolystoma xenopodis]|uniref:Uncharacterized protein n=1 Tax=Protopolystoma xenopodis TaxID=117903 RepID=A0A448X7R7_9PLAT|nr:unnamed protein product [Protopolystoma xenopodis]
MSALRKTIRGLVLTYFEDMQSRQLLDWLQMQFECCGIDEFHRDWFTGSQISSADNKTITALGYRANIWVPDSCCWVEYNAKSSHAAPPNDCGLGTARKPRSPAEEGLPFLVGLRAANLWYARVNNEACHEQIYTRLNKASMYGLVIIYLTDSMSWILNFLSVFV